jgi:hypothetical protein
VEEESAPGLRNFVPEKDASSERAAALSRALSEATGDPLDVPEVVSPKAIHPGVYVPETSEEPGPELVAVPASVFDDDFFRKPNEELRAAAPEATDWLEQRLPGAEHHAEEPAHNSDDLDIPAFLRRNNS